MKIGKVGQLIQTENIGTIIYGQHGVHTEQELRLRLKECAEDYKSLRYRQFFNIPNIASILFILLLSFLVFEWYREWEMQPFGSGNVKEHWTNFVVLMMANMACLYWKQQKAQKIKRQKQEILEDWHYYNDLLRRGIYRY